MNSRLGKTLLITVIFVAGVACGLSLDKQEVLIKWAVYRYAIDETLLRAILRFENGKRGYEAGLNQIKWVNNKNKWQDIQAYADPTMPEGAEQHCRLARRLILHTQDWIFRDAYRRREWLKDWSKSYHCGGETDFEIQRDLNNRLYYESLRDIWLEERDLKKTGKTKPIFQVTE